MRFAALLLAALAVAPVQAQEGPGARAGLAAAQARWEALPPERRAELERRFDELRRMDAERRRGVESRFERLRGAEVEALAELSEGARAELDALEPAERRRVARELAHDALLEHSRLAREALPPPVRARLEGADAENVRRFVRERKRARGPRPHTRPLERAAERLGVPPGERGELETLSPEELETRLMERHRRAVERDVERGGLPPWVEPGEWERWRGLPEREFFRHFERRRRERGGGPPGAVEGRRGPGSGRRGLPGAHELLRPDPLWRVELAELTPGERRTEIGARVRARALEVLEREHGLSTDQLEALRELEGSAFAEAVRRLLR